MPFQVVKVYTKRILITLIIVAVFTPTTLITLGQWEQRKEIEALNAETFQDYMVYHAIEPLKKRVLHRSEVWMRSDFEVKKGSFEITWRERVECDRNPYDKKIKFVRYKKAQATDGAYTKKVPRREIKESLWPMNNAATGEVMRYPTIDADCRPVSIMIMALPYGIKKRFEMRGEVAHVRGFL